MGKACRLVVPARRAPQVGKALEGKQQQAARRQLARKQSRARDVGNSSAPCLLALLRARQLALCASTQTDWCPSDGRQKTLPRRPWAQNCPHKKLSLELARSLGSSSSESDKCPRLGLPEMAPAANWAWQCSGAGGKKRFGCIRDCRFDQRACSCVCSSSPMENRLAERALQPPELQSLFCSLAKLERGRGAKSRKKLGGTSANIKETGRLREGKGSGSMSARLAGDKLLRPQARARKVQQLAPLRPGAGALRPLKETPLDSRGLRAQT